MTTPRQPLVVGVGARAGVTAAEVLAAVDAVVPPGARVSALATLDRRAREAGLQEAAQARGWSLVGLPAEDLAGVPTPTTSARVQAAVGTGSVAEAAALAGGGELVLPRQVHGRVTVAVALRPEPAFPPRSRVSRPGSWTGAAQEWAGNLGHHGDVEATSGLVDLAVNVRAGAPPAWLRAVLHAAVEDSAAYPSPDRARAAVAAAYGRPDDEVLLTAGAAETFTLLARALTPTRAVVVHPSFTEPEAALRAHGHAVHRHVLPPPYELTPPPDDADLVVLGNPTNPTSVLHPGAGVAALCRPGRITVVDEAFADTDPGEPQSLAGRRDLPGLLVVRSLTKTWGLAGLRVGYALGPPDLIAALAAVQPHWPVSTPALAALEACSTPAARAEAAEWAVELAADRAGLLDLLPAGVTVVGEPRSSFVLLAVPDAARVRLALRTAGFAVRRGDTFPGLHPDHLRVAVRDPATSTAFAAALTAILETP